MGSLVCLETDRLRMTGRVTDAMEPEEVAAPLESVIADAKLAIATAHPTERP